MSAEERERLADDLLAWAKDTRAAYRRHNAGRDPSKPRRRPDLGWAADGIEMAAHAVRRGRIPEEVARRITSAKGDEQ